jgi:F-box-like
MSIDKLPDDVLLEIFDFFAEEHKSTKQATEKWQTLVHVCRRWRNIVFRSPRRLNLRLFCSNKTPARDTLYVWPALPLFIECNESAESVDDIVAVLERSECLCHIDLTNFESSDMEQFSAAMQVPFPELRHLQLWSFDETVSALPDSFLGGSAPRLEDFSLHRIPFPGLPKLLLSATHLITLQLDNIPHSGYISPEAIVAALSTLTRLKTLWLRFKSPQSRPDRARQRPPPSTRSVLPALTHFWFKGVSEYLEVVVTRIDTFRLNKLYITFFNEIVFDTPQLVQFISCTPIWRLLGKARVSFGDDAAKVRLSSQTSGKGEEIEVRIPCRELDWQVSSMEQVCTSCLPLLPALEDLHVHENLRWRELEDWEDNIENALWLELLLPFTSVKNLYLSEYVARRIVPALQELVGERATEVLPTLQNIFLEERQASGLVQKGIQQVIAVRQVAGHPIAVLYGQKVR